MNSQDNNLQPNNSLNQDFVTPTTKIEMYDTEFKANLLEEPQLNIESANSSSQSKLFSDSILLISENPTTQVSEFSFQKPVDPNSITNSNGNNKRLASIFDRDDSPTKKHISSTIALCQSSEVNSTSAYKAPEDIVSSFITEPPVFEDTKNLSPEFLLAKSSDILYASTENKSSEVVIISSSSPDPLPIDVEESIISTVTFEAADIKASENTFVLSSSIETMSLHTKTHYSALCDAPVIEAPLLPQPEIGFNSNLENNTDSSPSRSTIAEHAPKINIPVSNVRKNLSPKEAQNSNACKNKVLTLSTLPSLDPRIPKAGNIILAKSGDRARQLLRAIDVNQTTVKRAASSDCSSSEDEKCVVGGLDEFLSERPRAANEVNSTVKQLSTPTTNIIETKGSTNESLSSSEESSGEYSDSSSQSSESSEEPSHDSTENTACISETQENKPTVNNTESKIAFTLTDPQKFLNLSSSNPSNFFKRSGNLISAPHSSLDAHLSYESKFEKTILQWNFNAAGHFPINIDASTPYLTSVSSIPSKFNSVQEYKNTLEPLFFLECWAQLQKTKEEVNVQDTVLGNLLNFNQGPIFIELKIKLTECVAQLMENDVVLVTLDYNPDLVPKKPHVQYTNKLPNCKSGNTPLVNVTSNSNPILAKVINNFSGKNDNIVDIRCCFNCNNQRLMSLMKPNKLISFVRLTNLSHLYRDFHALQQLGTFPLVKEIIYGHADKSKFEEESKINQMISDYQLNESQALAILSSANKKKGFSIIQGPPGTGKTKTISGLVAVLLKQFNSQTTRPQKLLICAPSNAAVDEIVNRLKKSLPFSFTRNKLIRVGVIESIHPSVHEQTLDFMIEAELGSKATSDYNQVKLKLDAFNNEIKCLREALQQHNSERDEILKVKRKSTLSRKNKLSQVCNSIKKIEKQIETKLQHRTATFRSAESTRTSVRNLLLKNAEIICSTLSGAGHEMMKSVSCNFETVIIDEAAQSVELASLIPLSYGCTRCIMIGDPHQLPPTVISSTAALSGYNNSLFSRIYTNSQNAAHLLNVQYRMHPLISHLPSTLFYDNKLHDASNLETTKSAPWHSTPIFQPFCFFNVLGGESTTNHSKLNMKECEVACAITQLLFDLYPTIDFKGLIGVITPYKCQVKKMKVVFEAKFGKSILDNIEFNTIDGFQGQEKHIIIFSCVRATKNRGIGFLADVRRMNVGLTRAQKSLFVIGRANTLSQDLNWDILVSTSRARKVYFESNLLFDHVKKSKLVKK